MIKQDFSICFLFSLFSLFKEKEKSFLLSFTNFIIEKCGLFFYGIFKGRHWHKNFNSSAITVWDLQCPENSKQKKWLNKLRN